MPEEQATEAKDTTTYQVLEQRSFAEDDGANGPVEVRAWVEVGEPVEVGAGQKRQAIKAATADRDEAGKRGRFVAVSVGSWKPESRGVQLTDTWT
jgi:hypothetical protein